MHTLKVEQVVYTTKMDGQEITIDFSKMHHSWLEAHLKKAAQRFLNDTYSGLMPSEKLAQARKDLAVIHSGEAMPEKARRSGGGGGDPIKALALKNAKTDLMAIFKKRTKLAKIADIIGAGDDAVNKYFSADGTWRDEQVVAFIDKQKDAGKRDYVAEARDLLADDESNDDDDI